MKVMRMQRKIALAWLWLYLVLCVKPEMTWARTLKSSVPFIYVINYSDKWIKDPTAAQVFGDMPPDLLHIGKAVPVTHLWGPIPLMAGENQYTGGPGHTLDRNAIRLLTPEELEQKIKEITTAVERLHRAGIKLVMPYICFFTIAGDHESREGLWKFYDHWDEYAKWLGPKPPTDPTDWITKDATGKRIDSPYGFTPPYFAPLHRYSACPNNPSWNQFSIAIVKLIAKCGYDGVFVDNSTLGGDGCSHCEAAFKKWVNENFDKATLKRACGVEDVGDITLGNPNLKFILWRWHTAVIRDRLAMLRKAGAEVKPGFQTFANVGNYQRVLALGDGCDFFMFEDIEPPGCLVEGDLPPQPDALITVAPDVRLAMTSMEYNARHASTFSEVTAVVHYPRTCPLGQQVEITVKVLTVGDSNLDSDCLEEMTVRLTHLESGKYEEIRLSPQIGVGDPKTVPGAKRPPVDLKGTWMPSMAGFYAIDLTYRYTDREHLDVANRTLISDRLSLGNPYRVNLGGLAYTYNSRCKVIGLMKKVNNKGWENVQELALAEGAANGGRYAIQSSGEPQKKYWKFFRQHGEVMAGLVPYGSVILLYSYWGGNPGEIGRATTLTIQEYLSAQHILFHGLVDRDMEASDLTPAKGKTLILVCRHYDLTDSQIKALKEFVTNGGKLILEHADTKINFTPLNEVLGTASKKAILWDWKKPPMLAPALCSSEGRLRGVRFTAFIDPSPKPRRLVLHVLNYNVSVVETNPGVVTPIKNLTIRVPLPAKWKKAKVTVYDPDSPETSLLPCTVVGSTAQITLPMLRIYQMLELTAEE